MGNETELTLGELDRPERLALVALARRLMELDGVMSAAEAEKIAQLADTFGEDETRSLLEEASRLLDGKRTLQQLAAMVTRRDAQELVLITLFDIAAVNGIHPAESDLLSWLASSWGISLETQDSP